MIENMLKEILLFNIFESLFILLYFMICTGKKLSLIKIVFHGLMISVINWFASNLILIPIVFQLVFCLLVSIYLSFIFNNTIKNSIITVIKSACLILIIELPFIILYDNVLNIGIASMKNDFIRFFYSIPGRLVEFVFLYVVYKGRLKGGEINEKVNL